MQSWYTTHPKTLIPDDAWERKLDAYGLKGNSTFRFNVDNHQITVERSGMIAAIAYMSISDDTEFLQKIMEQHSVDTSDYELLGVRKLEDDEKVERTPLSINNISRTYIENQLIGAMALSETGIKSIENYLQREDGYIGLPVVCSQQESLWPNTRIDKFYNNFDLHGRPEGNVPMQIDARELAEWHVKACDISSPELLEIMFRGGVFNSNSRIDYGSQNNFLEDIFNSVFPELSHNVIKSINEVSDELHRSLIAEKIIASLSLMSSSSQEGHIVSEFMYSNLDADIYPDVIGSSVLKLNLLEWPVEEKDNTCQYHSVDQSSLLCDFATELMGVNHADFRTYHFKSLARFAKHWPEAHKNTDVDVNKLVVHVMLGLDEYLNDPRLKNKGKDFVFDGAINRMAIFLKFASSIAKPDYEKLNVLPSSSKRILCMHGYKIKNFTGMSHQDKGRVLCDDLGM